MKFVMKMMVLSAIVNLCACGGGVSVTPEPVATSTVTATPVTATDTNSITSNQALGGVWTTSFENGNTGVMMSLDNGTFLAAITSKECTVYYTGTLSDSGNVVEGTGEVQAENGDTNCQATEADQFSGTIVQNQTLYLTDLVGVTTWSIDPNYMNGSSYAQIQGDYSTFGNQFTIDANGVITGQNETNIKCTINGQVAIVNAAENIYQVNWTYSNCPEFNGPNPMNDATASGLAYVNTAVTPNVLVIGYTVTETDNSSYVEVDELETN